MGIELVVNTFECKLSNHLSSANKEKFNSYKKLSIKMARIKIRQVRLFA